MNYFRFRVVRGQALHDVLFNEEVNQLLLAGVDELLRCTEAMRDIRYGPSR